MTLTLPAFRSTQSRWRRLKDALLTGYRNLQLRRAERADDSLYVRPRVADRWSE